MVAIYQPVQVAILEHEPSFTLWLEQLKQFTLRHGFNSNYNNLPYGMVLIVIKTIYPMACFSCNKITFP